MPVRLLGTVLQTLGMELIVLGYVSYMAELWVRYKWRGDEVTPPRLVVAVADLTRASTHASPLIALTISGILLVALGAALRRLDTEG
jgi:hypothetical protein